MPFALIFVGIVLVISAVEGTEISLGQQLKKDFTGQGSYLYWAVALVAVGAIGYVNELKKFSDTFMALLLVSLLFQNSGVFSKLTGELASANNNPVSEPATDAGATGGGKSGGGGGGFAGAIGLATSAVGDFF